MAVCQGGNKYREREKKEGEDFSFLAAIPKRKQESGARGKQRALMWTSVTGQEEGASVFEWVSECGGRD